MPSPILFSHLETSHTHRKLICWQSSNRSKHKHCLLNRPFNQKLNFDHSKGVLFWRNSLGLASHDSDESLSVTVSVFQLLSRKLVRLYRFNQSSCSKESFSLRFTKRTASPTNQQTKVTQSVSYRFWEQGTLVSSLLLGKRYVSRF